MLTTYDRVHVAQWRKKRLAVWLAGGLWLLLGTMSPVGAQPAAPASESTVQGRAEPKSQSPIEESNAVSLNRNPATDQCATNIERAKQLLQGEQPLAALRALDAAFAIRQEPLVPYLQGLAFQRLGNHQEALLRYRRFLVAAGGECCAAERADASRSIAKLLQLSRPTDGAVQPVQPTIRALALQAQDSESPRVPALAPSRGSGRVAAIVIPSVLATMGLVALGVYGLSQINFGSSAYIYFGNGR